MQVVMNICAPRHVDDGASHSESNTNSHISLLVVLRDAHQHRYTLERMFRIAIYEALCYVSRYVEASRRLFSFLNAKDCLCKFLQTVVTTDGAFQVASSDLEFIQKWR
jgi:hypothetical protein